MQPYKAPGHTRDFSPAVFAPIAAVCSAASWVFIPVAPRPLLSSIAVSLLLISSLFSVTVSLSPCLLVSLQCDQVQVLPISSVCITISPFSSSHAANLHPLLIVWMHANVVAK